MKKRILFLAIFLLINIGCSSSKQNRNYISDDNGIDSIFQNHFFVINSVVNDTTIIGNVYETYNKDYMSAVFSLSNISEVIARIDHDYIGTYCLSMNFLREDLEKWKIWYNENKNRLTWDSTRTRIMLK